MVVVEISSLGPIGEGQVEGDLVYSGQEDRKSDRCLYKIDVYIYISVVI